jgi:hypothetical protein
LNRLAAILAAVTVLGLPSEGRAQAVSATFLYKLSSTTGVIPFHGLAVHHDPYHNETLVVGGGRVRLFNSTGMEVFSFGDDPESGSIVNAAPMEDGDFVLLSYFPDGFFLVRVNFRGEARTRIEITGLPDEVPRPFSPNGLGYAQGRVYLADLGAMRVVVVGMDGRFEKYWDLAKLCEVADKRADNSLKGFRVAPNGDVLFTVPSLFRAFVLRPDGTFQSFGVKGSAPGKFNIVSGIAVDERGYYYVADILKSAVLVFDKDFRWLKEFGYRGVRPGSIVAPVDVAAGDGKVFVSQFARKGVSVFEIKIAQPEG